MKATRGNAERGGKGTDELPGAGRKMKLKDPWPRPVRSPTLSLHHPKKENKTAMEQQTNHQEARRKTDSADRAACRPRCSFCWRRGGARNVRTNRGPYTATATKGNGGEEGGAQPSQEGEPRWDPRRKGKGAGPTQEDRGKESGGTGGKLPPSEPRSNQRTHLATTTTFSSILCAALLCSAPLRSYYKYHHRDAAALCPRPRSFEFEPAAAAKVA